jgi:hypothetical protein
MCRKIPDRILPALFGRLMLDQTRDHCAGCGIVRPLWGRHTGWNTAPVGHHRRVPTVRCERVGGGL